MLPLVIKSNNAGDRLVIEPDRPDYWTATLDCSELHARHTFYDLHIQALPHFLTGLARSWRGWDGEREWKSLEGDVAMTDGNARRSRNSCPTRDPPQRHLRRKK